MPDKYSIYRTANFLTSAAHLSQAPPDHGFEVAFTGRSNSGKSSAINALCNQNSLSRTSKTPGRTQLLNFFYLDDDRRLVDLPGYGYAAAPGKVQERWQESMTDYLSHRTCLRGLILLMDIRHPLVEYDLNLLNWSKQRSLKVHILLTKADKLNRGPATNQLLLAQRLLHQHEDQSSIQTFSSLKHQGLNQVYAILNNWLELHVKAEV